MMKARVGRAGELTLDHFGRCGGIWFEPGEVQGLRRREPGTLFNSIPLLNEVSRAPSRLRDAGFSSRGCLPYVRL